jgi:hypothetical protein
MHHLEKRLQKLEEQAKALRSKRLLTMRLTLDDLPDTTLELLIGSFGAERTARELTPEETVARQAFRDQCDRNDSGSSNRRKTNWNLNVFNIFEAMFILQSNKFHDLSTMWQIEFKGRQPTEEESVRFQIYQQHKLRLVQLAGFATYDECFKAVMDHPAAQEELRNVNR